jgi:hypothetical protein
VFLQNYIDQYSFNDFFYRVTKPGGYIEVAGRCNEYVGVGPIYRKLMDASNYIFCF